MRGPAPGALGMERLRVQKKAKKMRLADPASPLAGRHAEREGARLILGTGETVYLLPARPVPSPPLHLLRLVFTSKFGGVTRCRALSVGDPPLTPVCPFWATGWSLLWFLSWIWLGNEPYAQHSVSPDAYQASGRTRT